MNKLYLDWQFECEGYFCPDHLRWIEPDMLGPVCVARAIADEAQREAR